MAHRNRQSLIAAFSYDDPDSESTALGPELERLCEEGRTAWPDLELADETFCGYLGARLAAQDVAEAVSLFAADLFLACGCTLRVAGAAEHFMRAHRDIVMAALSRIVGPADQQEVVQRIWQRMLVAADGETPKIAQYKGRGPLRAFVRVAAVRMAISLVRKTQPVAADEAEIQRLADDSDDPEVQYLKQLYRHEFRRSFAAAMASLPPTQQLLLRLDIVDGLTIDEAARVYGRSRTTTGRHLLEARQAIGRETLNDLRTRLDVPTVELESVARLVRSQIDLSVQRLLAEA